MAYLVSARKYRPQLFEELVGQEHIANTLRNAIAKGRVGHAYLFSGPRGIGKTSAARIFAKALNCEKGPTPTPCGSCVFCREITSGIALDIVEIDGASNNSVDNVRDLRENVRFVPSSARYKIYIIDEVHMLSTAAFNALLKTLEEPPEHIVFIFATTEVNKVPQTIRSRCQQFVFKRITIPRILEMLKRICSDLKVQADEKALFWIARGAQGSMRDAESILDQMISYSGGDIKEEDVFYVLGIPGYDVYHRIGESIAREDAESCLSLVERLLGDGIEVGALLSGLIEYYRNLFVLASSRDAEELVGLPSEDLARMKALLAYYSQRDAHNILTILSKAYLDTRTSDLARELFEIALMKMARYREIIQPGALIRRMEELKKEIDGLNPRGPGGNPAVIIKAPERPGGSGAKGAGPEGAGPEGAEPGGSGVEGAGPGGAGTGVGSQPPPPAAGSPPGAAPDGTGDAGDDVSARVVSHIGKSRRALAEFLSRAKGCTMQDNLLTFTYALKEKLGFEHVSEDSTRRYIERVVDELVGKGMKVRFVIEHALSGEEDKLEQLRVSPGVSKVLDIFKGDIVPTNNLGGS